jgi:hypothetical protein
LYAERLPHVVLHVYRADGASPLAGVAEVVGPFTRASARALARTATDGDYAAALPLWPPALVEVSADTPGAVVIGRAKTKARKCSVRGADRA